MARAVKTFTAQVKDKKGWKYKQAFVAIWSASETSQNTYESKDCKGDYAEDISSHTISYMANFWMDKATQLEGLPSQPLLNKVESEEGAEVEFTEIFNVDLEHVQSVQVINSNAPSADKVFTLIELDLVRRFK